MKKLKNILLLSLSFSLLFLTSCEDDNDNQAAPPGTFNTGTNNQTAQNFTDKDYKYSDYTVKVDGITFFSFADLDDCQKDGTERFNADGTGLGDEGPTKCDPSDPQTYTYTWILSDNDTKINLDFGDGYLETYTILINDGTILKLESTEMEDTNGNGNLETIVNTITFKKI